MEIYPKFVHEVWCKKSAKVKSGGERGHTAPTQEHFNFKDPSEVIYLMKKYINRKIKDRESDFRLKHASGAFGPGADWIRHAAWHRRPLFEQVPFRGMRLFEVDSVVGNANSSFMCWGNRLCAWFCADSGRFFAVIGGSSPFAKLLYKSIPTDK